MVTPADTMRDRPARAVVAVRPGALVVGGAVQPFVAGDATSMLRNYLTLVRSMRNQKRAAEIDLRRDDIQVLAAATGQAPEAVLDRLATLMGATRTQRTALLAVFATGALVLTLATSAAASPAADAPPTSLTPVPQPAAA
ncbi:MAG TPA: hypothetical protein PLV68_13150, partial [Ilumatobacteraceae bacterium]|nr:hypothetical protein [Ilumatobacteraceae bacterium]